MTGGDVSSGRKGTPPDQRRSVYVAAALILFCTEIAIAVFIKTGFIRHTLGDALVVMLLYAALMAATRLSPFKAAALCCAFAFVVETGQAFNLVDRLGVGDTPLARIVVGTTFSWGDLAAYAAGGIVCIAIETGVTALRDR